MNGKHTPGPWMVDGFDIRCNPQEDDTGTFVAEMNSSIAPGTTMANAHLIASAPTLYEFIAQKARMGDAAAQETLDSLQLGY